MAVNLTGLHGKVNFGGGHIDDLGADLFPHFHPYWQRRKAHAETIKIFRGFDGFIGGHVARAAVLGAEVFKAALTLRLFNQRLAGGALHIGIDFVPG